MKSFFELKTSTSNSFCSPVEALCSSFISVADKMYPSWNCCIFLKLKIIQLMLQSTLVEISLPKRSYRSVGTSPLSKQSIPLFLTDPVLKLKES